MRIVSPSLFMMEDARIRMQRINISWNTLKAPVFVCYRTESISAWLSNVGNSKQNETVVIAKKARDEIRRKGKMFKLEESSMNR